jgi:hypothetical protein
MGVVCNFNQGLKYIGPPPPPTQGNLEMRTVEKEEQFSRQRRKTNIKRENRKYVHRNVYDGRENKGKIETDGKNNQRMRK